MPEIGGEPLRCERCFELLLQLRVEEHLEPVLGDSLAHERLRGRHEQDRFLPQASLAHEPLLLCGMLGVVPRVRLVGGERDEVGRRRLHVGVHHDAAR